MMIRTVSSLIALTMFVACSPGQATPPKSPTGDNQPPATTTGNGEVLGADHEAPAQKLDEGVKIDAKDGIKPAATPPAE